MRRVLGVMADLDYKLSPPQIAAEVYPAINDCLGVSDPYAALKQEYNRRALALHPRLTERLARSDRPFAEAVRIALAGNLIDFGAKPHGDSDIDIEAAVERCLATAPGVDETEELERRAAAAGTILYLADNAGEIALDRLLIEQLPSTARVRLAVRGGPIINDVTREDVAAVGLDGAVEVIEPGVTLPGVWLEGSSSAFRRAFDDADLIISKGQGNFETLHDAGGYPLFFLFMVKCPIVSRHVALEVGESLVAAQKTTYSRRIDPRESDLK